MAGRLTVLFVLHLQSFLENSHPAIQSLESLQARAMEEFFKVASYFGEDGKSTRTEAFFGIFTEFISKFEVSFFTTTLLKNVLLVLVIIGGCGFSLLQRALGDTQSPENPRSPGLASPLAW